jgi:hypothetical protein
VSGGVARTTAVQECLRVRASGYRIGRMRPQLPPPDPHEPFLSGSLPDLELAWPTAIFAGGPPTREQDRLADAILDLRPGALFVVARG